MIRLIVLLMAVTGFVTAGQPAFAVPRVLQYQGRLTDGAGAPLHEPVDVTFSLHGAEQGGEPLWSQTFEHLALDNGRFNVLLGGEDAPFTLELLNSLHEGEDLYLGIQVGDDPEMAPRQQIASVPYALHAALADTAEFALESEHAATADAVAAMPGVAFQSIHRLTIPSGSSLSVVSVTLNAPAAGLVLVTGTGTLVLDNSTGSGALSHANIGEDLDGTPEATMGLAIAQVDRANVRASFYVPITCQRVYVVTPGEHTYYFNVNNQVTGSQLAANRPSITALFVPGAFGTSDIQPADASSASRGR